MPPPASLAVPVIVTVVPLWMFAPPTGEVIVEVGAAASLDADAATSPGWSVPGCAPMSASRLTVACRMLGSGVTATLLLFPSRPHDHCTVPAPKTSALLGAR